MDACHVVKCIGRDVVGLALAHERVVFEQILHLGVVRFAVAEDAAGFVSEEFCEIYTRLD